jgi:hypothetical protein
VTLYLDIAKWYYILIYKMHDITMTVR